RIPTPRLRGRGLCRPPAHLEPLQHALLLLGDQPGPERVPRNAPALHRQVVAARLDRGEVEAQAADGGALADPLAELLPVQPAAADVLDASGRLRQAD